jgi:hypothetical protein
MSRRGTRRGKPGQVRALATVPPGGPKAKGRRARNAASTALALNAPEAEGDRRAALLTGCYRAAAQHDDAALALMALKLRLFSGHFGGGGRVSFRAEGACLLGVYGCLTDLAHRVSTKALERTTDDGPLPDGNPLTPHKLGLLVKNALLAAEELETLRDAYKKETTETRG